MKPLRRGIIQRVFHPHDKCEEYPAGMWRTVSGVRAGHFINASADLMRCPAEFKEAMQQAVKLWPLSAEHNLTCVSLNRIAWLGHAGCCVATNSPEDLTRLGWHTLNIQEQDEANRVAGEVLKEWEADYLSRGTLFA